MPRRATQDRSALDGISAHRFRLLAGALIGLLLVYPYADRGLESSLALIALNTVVLVVAVYSVSTSRTHLLVASALAGATLLFNWWDVLGHAANPPGSGLMELGLAAEVAFYAYVLTLVAARVFRSPRVGADTLAGSVCVYILLGLCFTAAFVLVERLEPGSFALPSGPDAATWPDLLFFSFTALTTVGYGNITPISQQACSLATVETCAGVLYTTILVARLVGLYQAERQGGIPDVA